MFVHLPSNFSLRYRLLACEMNASVDCSQHNVIIGGWNRHSDPVRSERGRDVTTAVLHNNCCKINKALTNFGALMRTLPDSQASNSSDIRSGDLVSGQTATESPEVKQLQKLLEEKTKQVQQKDDQIHKLEKHLAEKTDENDELRRQIKLLQALPAPSVPPRAKMPPKLHTQRANVSPQHRNVVRKHYTTLVKFVAVDYVAGAMYESQGLDLVSFEHIQQLASVNRFDAVKKLLSVILKGDEDVYQKFLDALLSCEQEDLCNMLLEDEALDKTHVEAMQQLYDDLVRNINSSSELLSYLYSLGFLTMREIDAVEGESVQCGRNETLLRFARRKSSSKFDLFLKALGSTNQHTLAKKLDSKWSRLRNKEASLASRPPTPPPRTYFAKRR